VAVFRWPGAPVVAEAPVVPREPAGAEEDEPGFAAEVGVIFAQACDAACSAALLTDGGIG
jgi:hypothetical protein